MTPSLIVAKLESIGVRVHSPSGDRLKLTAESGNVPPEAVELAKAHKAALLAFLALECSPHNNPLNYVDVPAPGGRIRTTCRVCGKFIGYRPEASK